MRRPRGRSAWFAFRTRVLVDALIPSLALLAGVSGYLIVTGWEHPEGAQALASTTRHVLITSVRLLAAEGPGTLWTPTMGFRSLSAVFGTGSPVIVG